MNAQLLALLIHDLKNQLGQLETELAQLARHPEAARAHHCHQHCALLRQRLVAYLTLYAAPDKPLLAMEADESPTEFLRGLQSVESRPDGAPVSLGDVSQAPAFWYFDARLVRLALEAALHNAWRFAREQVLLGAREQDGFLVLSVEDDGLGLGTPDPHAESSTGLGMELCAAVARAHQQGERLGRVSLDARTGGGTRFELWLP